MPGLSIAAFAKSSWELASRNSGVEGHDCSDHCGQALGPRTQLSRMFYTVEELIGPHTINTIPPATLNAFRDHGRAANTRSWRARRRTGAGSLGQAGCRPGGNHTEKLLADGITAFTHSLGELLASLKEKRRVLLETGSPKGRKSERSHRVIVRPDSKHQRRFHSQHAGDPIETSPRLPALGVYAKPGHRAFSR